MTDIGNAIRELRMMSPYRDLRAFASQAGISYEGLRKIEVGDRIPSSNTVGQIAQAVGLSADETKALQMRRDLEHAKREGLVNKAVTPEKMAELADRAFEVFEQYLAGFEPEIGFDKEDAEHLRVLLKEGLQEELRE